jgi:hypothetical protein
MLSAGVVFLGHNFLALGVRGFALVNIALDLLWLVIALQLVRRYRSFSAPRA